jgi:hypothetical protein
MMIISLQDERERRHQAKVQKVYKEIRDDSSNYEDAIHLAEALPFNLQVRLVKYCLTNLVSLNDITCKTE